MIRVGVFYPHKEGKKFDMKYYLEKHMPMVKQKVGPALKACTVDAGVAGGAPGAPISFVAVANLTFDSVEAFQNSFGAKAGEILSDIPNYTDIEPLVQISDVKM
jgi:uncharacterized protein (TIGR02118 family)